MGYTEFSDEIFMKYAPKEGSICELGNQTMYCNGMYGMPAKHYFENNGYKHTSVDLNGEDGSIAFDLCRKNKNFGKFDIVTDFGTSEHIENLEACWYNKFHWSKNLIISENPEVGSWPGHGFHWFTEKFYLDLSELTGLKILELGRHPAMGNTTDGWNVYCVMKKTKKSEFTGMREFFEKTNTKNN